MPVDSTHPAYNDNKGLWQRCRDVFAGSDTVKNRGTRYLPKVSTTQPDADYKSYRDRALFYGATSRTVFGLVGAVFRKAGDTRYPLEEHLEDISLDSTPFWSLAKDIFEETLLVGRHGALVDWDSKGQERPYLVTYTAEQIRNWQTAVVKGITVPSLVVLSEQAEVTTDDPFLEESSERFRVLLLDEEGYYKVEIWSDGRDGYQITDEFFPTRRGERLDFIPFTFFGPVSIKPYVAKPPLLDLVDVNLSHYRTSADLEHGRHWTGLPTLFVKGFDEDTEISVGSSQAIIASNVQADAKFIEFTGQGLKALQEALKEKEEAMAKVGARLLEPQRKGVETAEALRLRQGSEEAVLRNITEAVSQGLTQCLKWMAWWISSKTEDVICRLNDDFVAAHMDPAEMKNLVFAHQAGLISTETFLWNLERGEMLPPGRSIEEEKHMIEAEIP